MVFTWLVTWAACRWSQIRSVLSRAEPEPEPAAWETLPADIMATIKSMVFRHRLARYEDLLAPVLRKPAQLHQPCVNLHSSSVDLPKYKLWYRCEIRNRKPVFDTFEVRFRGGFSMLDVEANAWWVGIV